MKLLMVKVVPIATMWPLTKTPWKYSQYMWSLEDVSLTVCIYSTIIS